MSDNLPLEIQMEIMKRLTMKPLLQFRTVSKAWKSMIDSSHFIAHYEGQVQHLLVNYHHTCVCDPDAQTYVSVVDDDTFPQYKVSPIIPELVCMLRGSDIIGSSHGLLCLDGYAYCPEDLVDNNCEKRMVVLWNIPIRKVVAVVVPYVESGYHNVLGFGVCRETNDHKIVNIKLINNARINIESVSYMPWQVEVFTLSTGVWRSVGNNLPRKSVELFGSQVDIDETLYWIATDRVTMGSENHRSYNMIISFDITSEEFREVNLPDNLANDQAHEKLCISKLSKSLVVLERDDGVAHNPSFIVWMMEYGIYKSFTKLFTINTPDVYIERVLGFRMNGEPILAISKPNTEPSEHPSFESLLVAYKTYRKRIEDIGIDGVDLSFSMSSYMETLHLHEQPNSIIYHKGKRFILKQSGPDECDGFLEEY